MTFFPFKIVMVPPTRYCLFWGVFILLFLSELKLIFLLWGPCPAWCTTLDHDINFLSLLMEWKFALMTQSHAAGYAAVDLDCWRSFLNKLDVFPDHTPSLLYFLGHSCFPFGPRLFWKQVLLVFSCLSLSCFLQLRRMCFLFKESGSAVG